MQSMTVFVCELAQLQHRLLQLKYHTARPMTPSDRSKLQARMQTIRQTRLFIKHMLYNAWVVNQKKSLNEPFSPLTTAI